jgi:hypothetical protein
MRVSVEGRFRFASNQMRRCVTVGQSDRAWVGTNQIVRDQLAEAIRVCNQNMGVAEPCVTFASGSGINAQGSVGDGGHSTGTRGNCTSAAILRRTVYGVGPRSRRDGCAPGHHHAAARISQHMILAGLRKHHEAVSTQRLGCVRQAKGIGLHCVGIAGHLRFNPVGIQISARHLGGRDRIAGRMSGCGIGQQQHTHGIVRQPRIT